MLVCICRCITDGQIREIVSNKGAKCITSVNQCIGEPTRCGKCVPYTKELIQQTIAEKGTNN